MARPILRPGYFVFDLETIEDPENPPKPNKDGEKPAFPAAPHWKVVSASFLYLKREAGKGLGSGYGIEAAVTFYGHDERAIIEKLLRWMAFVLDEGGAFISWNGGSFDMPVLVARAMKYGIVAPWLFSSEVRYRYAENGHVDLMDWMTLGSGKSWSLHAAAKLCGFTGKLDAGASVAGHVESADWHSLVRYSFSDVVLTAGVLARYLYVTGRLEREDHDALQETLLHHDLMTKVEPSLEEFYAAGDRVKIGPVREELDLYDAAQPGDITVSGSAAFVWVMSP